MQYTIEQLERIANLIKWSREALEENDLNALTLYQTELRYLASLSK